MKQLRSLRALTPRCNRILHLLLASALILQPALFAATPKTPARKTTKTQTPTVTSALTTVLKSPAVPAHDKRLIEAVPLLIELILNASNETTTIDTTTELENIKNTLTLLITHLSNLEKDADETLAASLKVVREMFEQALQAVSDLTTNKSDLEGYGISILECLQEIKDALDEVLFNQSIIESKLDACCESIQSKIDEILDDVNFSKITVIESKLDACCDSIQSKIDEILDDATFSKVMVVESKLDVCCDAIQSKIDGILDPQEDAIQSTVEVVESKLDNCCATINSKLDVIDNTADLTLSQVDVVESKLDNCCATVNSKLDVIDETADTIASKVCDLHDCAGIPIFADGQTDVTISTPGYYCVAANACGHLTIAANNVYVDLNNHTLCDISISSGMTGVTVYNGSVVGAGSNGILVGNQCSCINLHDITVKNAALNGINVGTECNGVVIRNCSVAQCGDTGILVLSDSFNVTIEHVNIAGCDNSGIFFAESTELYVSHVNIQNILGSGANAAISLVGTDLTAVNNVTLDNVHIKNSVLGIYMIDVNNVCIADSSIQQVSGGISAPADTTNISLRNVCIEDVQGAGGNHGINVQENADSWNLDHVSIKDCNGTGMLFDGTTTAIKNVSITNAFITACVEQGIILIECENATIKHSTIAENGNNDGASGGVYLDTCSFCNLIENKIVNNFGDPAHGVKLETCIECSVIQNYIENNFTDNNFASVGLLVEGLTFRSTVMNNIITHNSSDAFPANSFGIRHLSNDASNKFFGNYACGHNDNYFQVDFIRELENAGPYHNVECELVGENIDDLILSKVCVVESKLDQCCTTLNSKVDVIDNELEACCETLNSKVDVVDNEIAALNSDLDNCCETLNSKVDVIDNELEIVQSSIQTVDNTLVGCCTLLDSKVDVIDNDLEACCATLNSKLSVLEANQAVLDTLLVSLIDNLLP